jgi:hypothetical protein
MGTSRVRGDGCNDCWYRGREDSTQASPREIAISSVDGPCKVHSDDMRGPGKGDAFAKWVTSP